MITINKLSVLLMTLKIFSIQAAPMQLQWQSQMSMQPMQEEVLQNQLLALQQLQAMNEWNNNLYPPILQKMEPPLMIILPEVQQSQFTQIQNNDLKTHNKNNHEGMDHVTENEDLDSVIIQAEPTMEPKPEPAPKKAILLIPGRGRFSIGGLISAIPFLPIEINVPDTISWIYNGIASIISGIGQRLPFRPAQNTMPQGNNLRNLLTRLQTKNQNNPTPILVLPDVAQVYPMQF